MSSSGNGAKISPSGFRARSCKATGLCDGDRVEIEAHDGDIVIRRPIAHFTLAELFGGKSPEQWRTLYAEAFDWGPDVGREAVEE